MSVSDSALKHEDHAPLLSPRVVTRLTAAVVALAAFTAGIGLAGRWYGENLALAGHTASTENNDIFIGEDHLRLASNVIRFEAQRATGMAERTDLYLTWPKLEGYTDETRAIFNDVDQPQSLIFLQIAQSTMSRDMSGRLEPIYRHLFKGQAVPAVAGLSRHDLQDTSGYGREVFFTGEREGKPTYVVRCALPATPAQSISSDCQRDVHAGKDLAVLYRFSSQLLPQWQVMDDAVMQFIDSKLVP